MKTLIIDGDIWFVDKLSSLVYYEEDKDLEIRYIGSDEKFTYNDFEKEEFEALKFELANLLKT